MIVSSPFSRMDSSQSKDRRVHFKYLGMKENEGKWQSEHYPHSFRTMV